MATSFDKIYALNQVIQNNRRLKAMPDNLFYHTLFQYLSFAIAHFRKKCFKDLDDRTDFVQQVYEFTVTGTTANLTLNPPPPTNATIYVEVNDVETTNFTFTAPNTLEVTNMPNQSNEIYVGAYVIGEFNPDLNIDEQRILAEGMNIPFVENEIFATKALEQVMYSSGVNWASQGNHNKASNEIRKEHYQRLNQMIVEYTFLNDSNNLMGLVGRGVTIGQN